MKTLNVLLASALFAAISFHAQAGPVTIDFEDWPSTPVGNSNVNVTQAGYRFSPTCHIDTMRNYPVVGRTMIGWDRSGCDWLNNSNYIGGVNPFDGSLYIDQGGDTFTLNSLVAYVNDFSTTIRVTTSKGDVSTIQAAGYAFTNVVFAGEAWRDLSWISIQGGGGAPHFYMDSITFGVPEPGTLGLMAIALGSVALMRRRRIS